VFPRIPGLFIVLPLYILAEKAAQAILADSRYLAGQGGR
jgi:hypothetical protein